ncbi:MAG: glycosyltransferase family 39 protein [Bacillota bacterium]|nr:glycosyltransferase family 39 protein [Bacillota bacterium]
MEFKNEGFTTRIESFIEKYYYGILLCALLLPLFNLFFKLSSNAIQDWDEARHGVTAFEMIKNNNFLVSTYGNSVDYYNFKPPLGMWAIALSYKLFGYNAFALRFFSAISSFFTVVIVSKILKDNISKLASIMGVVLLSTNYLFVNWHTGRTGDFDAGLALLFTICMYFLLKTDRSIKNFYFTGLAFSVAFLLKSYATFQIVAVIGLILLVTGKLFRISFKEYVIFILCSFVPIFTWMTLRYRFDGIKFLKSMITYDVIARSTSTIEGHTGNILYYFKYLLRNNYYIVFFMLFILICYILLKKTKLQLLNNKFMKISIAVWTIVPFVLFSLSKSKLVWYINPVHPALTILIVWSAYKLLGDKKVSNKLKASIFIVFIICSLCGEASIVHKINTDAMPSNQKDLISLANNGTIKGEDIYTEEWSQSNMFIAEVLDGLNPKQMNRNLFVKNKVQGLYLLDNNKDSKLFIDSSKLNIVMINNSYIIVKQ